MAAGVEGLGGLVFVSLRDPDRLVDLHSIALLFFSSSSSSDLARVIGRSWKAALVECIQANVVWREVGWLMWSK